MKKKILALSGSTRKNSASTFVLQMLKEHYDDTVEVQLDVQLDGLPFFNPDLLKTPGSIPEKVVAFYQRIEASDGLCICTPEYVFSLPGVLKNALEWTVSTTLLCAKPCAFVVASSSGEKAFESLDLILTTLTQQPVDPDCKLLIRGSAAKIRGAQRYIEPATRRQLEALADAFGARLS